MGKTYRDLRKWRKNTPNQHRTYGERRNRDLKKYIGGFNDEL